MNNKKIYIFIITVALLLVAVIAIIFTRKDESKPSNEPSNPSSNQPVKTFDEILDEKIAAVNEINKIFSSPDLVSSGQYDNESDFNCKKYAGEDTERYKKLLEATYEKPYFEYGNFMLIESEKNNTKSESLYVCLPKNCTPIQITKDMYSVTNEEENTKTIGINYSQQIIKKNGDDWQFPISVIICAEKLLK